MCVSLLHCLFDLAISSGSARFSRCRRQHAQQPPSPSTDVVHLTNRRHRAISVRPMVPPPMASDSAAAVLCYHKKSRSASGARACIPTFLNLRIYGSTRSSTGCRLRQGARDGDRGLSQGQEEAQQLGIRGYEAVETTDCLFRCTLKEYNEVL